MVRCTQLCLVRHREIHLHGAVTEPTQLREKEKKNKTQPSYWKSVSWADSKQTLNWP